MDAVLSTRRDDDDGFREVGTEGRIPLRDCSRSSIIKEAAALQRRWHGRDVRVEEHDGSLYSPVSRVWTYHCACDLDRPCCFHSGAAEVNDCYCEED